MNLPKKPVGATTPSSFSYEKRAVEDAFWVAGAKAAAAAMREDARMSFMLLVLVLTSFSKGVNCERSEAVFFVFQNKNEASRLVRNSRS